MAARHRRRALKLGVGSEKERSRAESNQDLRRGEERGTLARVWGAAAVLNKEGKGGEGRAPSGGGSSFAFPLLAAVIVRKKKVGAGWAAGGGLLTWVVGGLLACLPTVVAFFFFFFVREGMRRKRRF